MRHIKSLLRRIAAPMASLATARTAAHRITIDTPQGKLIGSTHGHERSVHEFKGIPYAIPPVGRRRWKPPEAAGGWSGERLALEFGPDCVQAPYERSSFYYRASRPVSEDCLYLNVWTPSEASKLPVIVWIHGGALTRGSSAIDLYDGGNLARKGVVVVSMNYRLGVFGFFAHQELIDESDHDSAGNYGLLDQIEALKWVRQNISDYGGDPDNVTLMGQSAGAWNISMLCVSPLAKGLFHKVIAHSGGRLDKRPELEQAASAGAEFARAAGKTSVRQLRGMPALKLLAAADSAGFQAQDIVDGWIVPQQPWDIYAAAGQHAVPTLLGYNEDEGTTLNVDALVPPNEFIYRGNVRRLYDDHADDYLEIYPSTDIKRSCLDGFRDYWCGWPTIAWARMTHAAGQNSYVYRFAHKPPGKRRKELGAYHGGELAYVFDNVHLFGSKANVADYELAEIMSAFWASFATTGVPAVKRENTWPTFASGRQLYMRFEDGRAIVYADLFEDRRELWDNIMATLRSA